MSSPPPHQKRTPRNAGMLLAAGVLLIASEAATQQLTELRGTNTESQVLDRMPTGSAETRPESEDGLDSPRYRPVSPGGAGDEADAEPDASRSPFADDVFSEPDVPEQASRPALILPQDELSTGTVPSFVPSLWNNKVPAAVAAWKYSFP